MKQCSEPLRKGWVGLRKLETSTISRKQKLPSLAVSFYIHVQKQMLADKEMKAEANQDTNTETEAEIETRADTDV